MKSNKRMQALLSTAMCAAILFSNAAAVFAAEVPPLPRKEGENPLAEQSPVNLLRQPGAASSYQYGEDALYNMSNLDLLGMSVLWTSIAKSSPTASRAAPVPLILTA